MNIDDFQKYHTKSRQQVAKLSPTKRLQYLRGLDLVITEEEFKDLRLLKEAEAAARQAGVNLYLCWQVLGEIHYRLHKKRP